MVGLVSILFFLSHDVRFFEWYSPPKSHRKLIALDPEIVSKSVMSSCKFCLTSDLLWIAPAITNLEKSLIRVTIYLLPWLSCVENDPYTSECKSSLVRILLSWGSDAG